MNRRLWCKRAICVALAVFLLLIFCSVGHSCHHDHCPVCMLTAAFRLGLGVLCLTLGIVCLPPLAYRFTDVHGPKTAGFCSLVALKVKLSD